MSWIKLDDQWMDHPKMILVGRDARDMWLASITYCSKHLTDGFFSDKLLPQLAVMAGVDVANVKQFATALVDGCLWDACEGGYTVHDYLEYNPTKEQALATREARKEAGSAGGKARAANFQAKAIANPKQNASKSQPPPRTPPLSPNNGIGNGKSNAEEAAAPDLPEEKVYRAVTRHPTIPGGDLVAIVNAIQKIKAANTLDNNGCVTYLRPYWTTFKKRYPGSLGCFWLTDWAVIGMIPDPTTKKSKDLTPEQELEEQRAWRKGLEQ